MAGAACARRAGLGARLAGRLLQLLAEGVAANRALEGGAGGSARSGLPARGRSAARGRASDGGAAGGRAGTHEVGGGAGGLQHPLRNPDGVLGRSAGNVLDREVVHQVLLCGPAGLD